MKRSISMRVISTFLAVVVILSTFGVISLAADEITAGSYGYIIPTDAELKAQKNSYTFYGDSTVLYFMLFSMGKENAFYNVEIYSSKEFTEENIVSSFTAEYGNKGSTPLALTWPFKSNESGTYYGRCYTSIMIGEEEVIDKGTMCNFTIKLNRVGGSEVALTSISNSNDGITIKWATLGTALKYRIYRKLKNDKDWTKLADVGANVTSYKDKSVKSGVQYTYTVRAFDNMYSSLYNKKGLTTVFLTTPKLTVPKASTDVNPVIKWSQVSGAQGYYVYRKGGSLSASTSWTRIATIKNPATLTYTDKTATSPDWQYTYTVRAYYGSYKSGYDSNGVNYNYVTAPVLKSASSVVGGIEITWLDSNAFSNKYYVYRKAPGETKWTRIATSKTTSYVDKKVTNGVKYTYTVRAVSATNASLHDKTGVSATYLATPSLSKISIAKNGDVTLKWAANSKSKGYIVYKSVNGASWKQLAKITNAKTTSYVDKSAKTSGTEYTYTVRAINGSTKSYYVKPGLSTMYLAVPKVTATNDYSVEQGSAVKISWDSIKGAKNYRVYRKAENETSWTILADDFADKTYYDKTAQSGAKYYYTVRAKNGSYMGNYTSTALHTVLHAPILTDAVVNDLGTTVTWTAVQGAQNYTVYRRTLTGAWETLETVTTTEYTDTSLESKTTPYLYTVRATLGELKSPYMINGIKNHVSINSLDVLFEDTDAETKVAFNTITWTSDEADKFDIYRSVNGGALVLIASIPSTEAKSYIDSDLNQGSSYYYVVSPIKEGKLSINYTSETVKWDFPPIPVLPVMATPYYANTELADRIEIVWDSDPNAESYDVYRKTSDSDWQYLATVPADSELRYIDTAIEADVQYYYSVKGIASDRDSLFDSTGVKAMLKAPIEEITDMFAQLSDNPASPDKKQVTLAWAANENVSIYKVMRKTADSDWVLVGIYFSSDALVFTDTTIEKGVEYYYSIHTYAPDRPSINNLTGVKVLWPDDTAPEEETSTPSEEPTTQEGDSTEPTDTTAPSEESTVPPSEDATTEAPTTEESTEASTEPTTEATTTPSSEESTEIVAPVNYLGAYESNSQNNDNPLRKLFSLLGL